MQITDVRIRFALGEGKLKGYATVTFDDCFVVNNIKILDGVNGFFLAMPSRETSKGERRDVAHPINSEFRAELQAKVIEAFNAANRGSDAEV
ncbi:MAG: septation regulator SpoVG [Spirochaetaceae bacterium]|jgi:stage V sporulation protein G|nr:septation regulator SpoVG [Spirochaetaceae bacterium]